MAVRKLPDGRYEADYADVTGARKRPRFDRRKDAEAHLVRVTHHKNIGQGIDEGKSKMKFRDYAERWYQAQPKSPNYDFNVRSHLKNHILPVLGEKRLGQITHTDLQTLVRTSSDRLNPTSMHTMITTAKMIFKVALRERAIGHDPGIGLKMPKIEQKLVVPFSFEQIQRVADQMQDRYRALVLFTAKSGLRQGEVFGVQKHDICWDPGHGSVHVRRQVQSYTGAKRQVTATKTRTDRRVPLTDSTVAMLREHLEEFRPTSGVPYVFTNTVGDPLHRRVFDRSWIRARTKAGSLWLAELEDNFGDDVLGLDLARENVKKIETGKFHDLRHFYASTLIRAGLSVREVSERLGHANPAMTLRIYAHLWPEDDDRTRRAIESALEAS